MYTYIILNIIILRVDLFLRTNQNGFPTLKIYITSQILALRRTIEGLLNLVTTEIRKSKRTFEKKLAGNIKNDTKSFYAYVRSKQKVRDTVGPLENNSENIISYGFQMAVVLNEYFSSVFTTEDISSPGGGYLLY